MQSLKEMINSIYPSLTEVYATEYKDDKSKIQALLNKVYVRIEKGKIQLDNRVVIDWEDSPTGCCLAYFNCQRCNAEDTIYNIVVSDYNRVIELIDGAKSNRSVNRKERRQRTKNLKSLEYDLMLLDIIDPKRKTLIDVDLIYEGSETLTYKMLQEQLNALMELVGLVALCTDENNVTMKNRMWVEEQELRLNEWRHRELAEWHSDAVDDYKIKEAFGEYDMAIGNLINEVQVTNKSNMIRIVKLAIEGELTNQTPSLVSDLLTDKRRLIMTLMLR